MERTEVRIFPYLAKNSIARLFFWFAIESLQFLCVTVAGIRSVPILVLKSIVLLKLIWC